MPRMSKFTLNAGPACDAPAAPKELASVHTNTEPWQPPCARCKGQPFAAAAAQPGAVDVAEYTRALNYINSIHSLINHALARPVFKKCSGTPHVAMPELPNFLTIMANLGEMCMENNLRTAEKATSTTNLAQFERLEKEMAQQQQPPAPRGRPGEKNSDSDETSREEILSPDNDEGRTRTFYLMHGNEDATRSPRADPTEKPQKAAKADKHAKNSKAKHFLVQEGGDGQNVKAKKQSVNVYHVQACHNNERRDQRVDSAEPVLSEADLHRYASELLVGANWDHGKNYYVQQTGRESPGSSKSSLLQDDDYVAPDLESPRRGRRQKDRPGRIPTRECCSFTCSHQKNEARPEDVKPFKSAMKVRAVEMKSDPSAGRKQEKSPFARKSKGGGGVWKVLPYEVQQKECDDFLRPRRGRKERETAVVAKNSSGQLNKAFDGYTASCQKIKQTAAKASGMPVTGERDVTSFMSSRKAQAARNKAFRQARNHGEDADDVVTLTGCYKAEDSCSDSNNSYNSESSDIKSDRELAPSKAHPQKHILYVHKTCT